MGEKSLLQLSPLHKPCFLNHFFFLIVLLQCSKISVSITLCIINVSLFIYPFLNLPFFSYHLCPKWHRHPPDWVRILRNNWIPLSLSVLISSLVSHRFCLHRSSQNFTFSPFSASACTWAMAACSLCSGSISRSSSISAFLLRRHYSNPNWSSLFATH